MKAGGDNGDKARVRQYLISILHLHRAMTAATSGLRGDQKEKASWPDPVNVHECRHSAKVLRYLGGMHLPASATVFLSPSWPLRTYVSTVDIYHCICVHPRYRVFFRCFIDDAAGGKTDKSISSSRNSLCVAGAKPPALVFRGAAIPES